MMLPKTFVVANVTVDSFRLDTANAWRYGLRGALVMVAVWVAMGAIMHAWTGEAISWLVALMFGGGLVVQRLHTYFGWLKEAAWYAFDRRALAVIPPKLPSEHMEAELQAELRHYGVELAVLKAEFKQLRRRLGWTLLAGSVGRMQQRVNGVLDSVEFNLLVETAGDLRVKHDMLKDRMGQT